MKMTEKTTKPETTNHVSPISEFRVRYSLNPGLSDASRLNDPDCGETFPATRAQLAYALDWVDHENISLAGQYGDAGCHLVAIMDDGEIPLCDDDCDGDDRITEARAIELLTADGEVDADEVHALHEDVWDGHNHIPFVPSRSLSWLSEEDSWERMGHLLVKWGSEGEYEDRRTDEGWDVVAWYYGKLGNESDLLGCDDHEQVEEILESFGVEYDLEWLSDDDFEVLVPTEKMGLAQEVLTAGQTLDELQDEAQDERADELAEAD